MKQLLLDARWLHDDLINDDDDEEDYDASIVVIEGRYLADGSAWCELGLRVRPDDFVSLAKAHFTGSNVREQVEKWAQQQMDTVITLLRIDYRIGDGLSRQTNNNIHGAGQ